jgi:hypothetical protein
MEDKLDLMLMQLAQINSAFPDGPDAHRLAHQAMMKAAVAEERFWTELKIDIAKKGVWGLMIIVLGLAIVGISAKFGIGVVVK